MRVLRTLLGVLLTIVAVAGLSAAAVGWLARGHAGPDGSYSATLTVEIHPSWLDPATWIATGTGAVALAAAIAVLSRRRRRDQQLLPAERDRVIEFADLVAQRLNAHRPGQLAGTWAGHRDLTGEFARLPAARTPTTELPYVHSAT